MHTVEGERQAQELCIVGNFVEIFLAREHHGNAVGINYLEKIQLPHLPSLYGALLAGAAVIIVGAGIPLEFPAAMTALMQHQPAAYSVVVSGSKSGEGLAKMTFDPALFRDPSDPLPTLERPKFLPIISSLTLATVLVRRLPGEVDGFVIEGPTAGGHNAPPRGVPVLNEAGEPIYGPRDAIDLESIRKLGIPFWLAGGYGSPERLREAQAAGAHGVQVGTAFALCDDSELTPEIRDALIRKVMDGTSRVFTDPLASPTGFPFKVAQLPGTLSEPEVYAARRRVCDLGFLRQAYRRPDGGIGYRCPAEPVNAYIAKGGRAEDAAGRKCLCNGLVANIGLPQRRPGGAIEPPIVTVGDDISSVTRFCPPGGTRYTAADVVRVILGA
jgi:nitronate monooxygenase